MKNKTVSIVTELPKKQIARMAGLFYFLYMVTTIFADVVGRSKTIVYGDAVATANNIISLGWIFHLSFVVDLVSAVLFFLTAWALYILLKPVNKNLALLFLLLNLGGTAVYSVNLINQFGALILLSGVGYLKVFQVDQLQAMAMFFLDLYRNGFWVAQIFFGVWLLPLGYLVFKSGFIPKIIGIVMLVHFVGWISTFFQTFLFPDFITLRSITFPLGLISELGLTLWLLIKGVNKET
jgi:hypothetical protein